MIEAIELPKPRPGQRFAIREVAVRHGDFALAGLCAAATLNEGKLPEACGLSISGWGIGRSWRRRLPTY